METFDFVLRIVAFVGIGLFLWSAANSLEQMARALTRLSEKGPPELTGWGRATSGDTKEEPPLG